MTNFQPLSSCVKIDRHFLQSVRIDKDLRSADSLSGYIALGSSINILQQMSRTILDHKNCAFTWIGPYGSGKSSLALVFSGLLSYDATIAKKARSLLGIKRKDYVSQVFLTKKKQWHSINIVGQDASLEQVLADTLALRGISYGKGVIADLESYLADGSQGMVLLIDELGVFLSHAIKHNGMNFLQLLAEAAARSNGSLIVIGILHQSFEAYISNYSKEVRDEWAKVHGRFENYVLSPSVFESLTLIVNSIVKTDYHSSQATKMRSFAQELFGSMPQFLDSITATFANCLPLHPLSAILLCGLAKKSYGQNERSIFSFLTSREAQSFQNFLDKTPADSELLYTPDLIFDYLKANQTYVYSSARDMHQWEEAATIVARAERNCSELEIKLIKTIAIIAILGRSHFITPSFELLRLCFADISEDEFKAALKHLSDIKAILKKTYDNSFSLFAGSDFDFEEEFTHAYAKTEISLKNIKKFLSDNERIIAKRHYIQSGTLRWFTVTAALDTELERIATTVRSQNDCAGAVILVFVSELDKFEAIKEKLKALKQDNLIFVLSKRTLELIKLSRSIDALEMLSQDNRLEGDQVARQEINARLQESYAAVGRMVNSSIYDSTLIYQGQEKTNQNKSSLAVLVSDICDHIYAVAPQIHNELINRNKISSNVAAARRILLRAMVQKGDQERLGFEGVPAEFCIYNSLLKATKIHQQQADGTYRFASDKIEAKYKLLFAKTIDFIKEHRQVSAVEIFKFWSEPPFGLKKGPQPILLLALMLAEQLRIAIYEQEVFITEFDEEFIDEYIVSPERITLKWYGDEKENNAILANITSALEQVGVNNINRTPLGLARAVVRFVLSLPDLTQRTYQVSKSALRFKAEVIHANDPIDLLFVKLPEIFPTLKTTNEQLVNVLHELDVFYDNKLEQIKDMLYKTIRHDESQPITDLIARAKNIKQTTGSNKLEQFAAKIAYLDLGLKASLEGIISLCVEKPKKVWTDKEINTALAMIPQLSLEFRQAESFAVLHNRNANRRVFSVSFGAEPAADLIKVVDLSTAEQQQAELAADKLMQQLKGLPKDVAFAAIASLGIKLEKE